MTNIDTWLQRLKDKDPKVRVEAVYALSELGDVHAVEQLIELLDDSSSDVRKSAAVVLGWLKDNKAVEPLLNRLKKTETDEVSSLIYALSELDDKRVVEPLIQMALEAKSQEMRKASIRALGKLNDKRAIIPLIKILTNKKEPRDFLRFTRENFDRMMDAEGIKKLIEAFNHPYEPVKWFASKKLSELSEISFEPLVHAIKEGSGDIRKYSIITVAEMENNSKNIDFLNQFVNDAHLKYYAAIAVGRRGDTRVVDVLIEGITHPSAWVRENSAFALAVQKEKKALDLLITALKDPRKEVRAAAAFTLGELREEKAIEPLIQAMFDETGENYFTKGAIVRENTAEALGKIGDRAAEPLLKIVERSDIEWNIRFFAIIALAEMGNDKGINLLIQGINDSFWFMRYSCSRILRRFIEEKKIPPDKVKKPIYYFFDPQLLR
jgi:HEAT repeat protein